MPYIHEFSKPVKLQLVDWKGEERCFENVTRIESERHNDESSEITIAYTSEDGTPKTFIGIISIETYEQIVRLSGAKGLVVDALWNLAGPC